MQFFSKFADKAKKDPLVPVGCAATLACLFGGLYAFSKGKAALSQKLMRARVVAQSATILVLGIGTFLATKFNVETDKRPPGMTMIEYQLLQQEKEKEAK